MTRTARSKPLSVILLTGLLMFNGLLITGCKHQESNQGAVDKSPAQVQSDAQARAAGIAAQYQRQKH